MEVDASGTSFEIALQVYTKERDDLDTPHTCTAEGEAPEAGADLADLDSHADEFHRMLEEMFEKLPTETRILEGVEIPTYDELYQQTKNELSETNVSKDNGECVGDVAS